MIEDDPYVDPHDLKLANERHDREMAAMGITSNCHVRNGWNVGMMLRRGMLTDRKITKYAKAGNYSLEYRAARKLLMEQKAAKKAARTSNFVERNGRMIYVPN